MHVAAVPVGRQHRRDAVDLLDDHVVQERVQVRCRRHRGRCRVPPRPARTDRTPGPGRTRRPPAGRRRVRDVEDVEVGTGLLVVVHADEVDLGAGAPHPHRVVLMADRFVGPRRGAGAADQRAEHVGVIAGGLHERDGIAWVRDVIEVEPAAALRRRGGAGLVVDGEDVTAVGERDHVRALAVIVAVQRPDEVQLDGRSGLGDVDAPEAAAAAPRALHRRGPRHHVRRGLVDDDVGHLLRRHRAELVVQRELGNELDVASVRGQAERPVALAQRGLRAAQPGRAVAGRGRRTRRGTAHHAVLGRRADEMRRRADRDGQPSYDSGHRGCPPHPTSQAPPPPLRTTEHGLPQGRGQRYRR